MLETHLEKISNSLATLVGLRQREVALAERLISAVLDRSERTAISPCSIQAEEPAEEPQEESVEEDRREDVSAKVEEVHEKAEETPKAEVQMNSESRLPNHRQLVALINGRIQAPALRPLLESLGESNLSSISASPEKCREFLKILNDRFQITWNAGEN